MSITEEKVFDFSSKIMDVCELASYKKLTRFDGFIPTDVSVIPADMIVFTDAHKSVLAERTNISVYLHKSPGEGKVSALMNLREITHKELRKKTGGFALCPFAATVLRTEDADCCEEVFFNIPPEGKGKIRIITPPNYTPNKATCEQMTTNVQLLLGIQFTIENMCSVYLRPDEMSVGFTLPINTLAMAKDLFKLRDVAPGKLRRSALKHWVSEHYRGLPNQSEERIKIAKYLRGAERFDWLGMKGEIRLPVEVEG